MSRVVHAQPAPPLKPFQVPEWAFLYVPASTTVPQYDSVVYRGVPGSRRAFTAREYLDAWNVVDWFPDTHPAMPPSVRVGVRVAGRACAFCHLPDGAGRPENATLAGLPADYIVRQVRAFRDGTRRMSAAASPRNSMHIVAEAVSDSLVADAARYFAGLTLHRRNRIVEAARIPAVRKAGLLYALRDEATRTPEESIAGRLIEVPDVLDRHELHDPTVEYITYVPPGSRLRGQALAARGPAGTATACATCHGPRLLGVGAVPPIAGRHPSVILRQLINFRTGMRADSTALPMRAVVNPLSLDDMVALAAYVGGLPPSPRRH
ncbi:MAG: cytochrome C [Gemmatimonadetes bacterium]|nr:cytochrome C [Gemmatimonadota bacterium]